MENSNPLFQALYGSSGVSLRRPIPSEVLASMLGMDNLTRAVTIDTLRKFPAILHSAKPKKRRTRTILQALISREDVTCGNQAVENFGGELVFSYRDTAIYVYNAYTGAHRPLECAFEDSKSTQHQRKEIIKAIEEFETILAFVWKGEN